MTNDLLTTAEQKSSPYSSQPAPDGELRLVQGKGLRNEGCDSQVVRRSSEMKFVSPQFLQCRKSIDERIRNEQCAYYLTIRIDI